MFLEIVHGQNGFLVQPNNVIIYQLVYEICFEKYEQMNFETHCLHRLPSWKSQNSAAMAKFCHQNFTISNHFLWLMIVNYLNIYTFMELF